MNFILCQRPILRAQQQPVSDAFFPASTSAPGTRQTGSFFQTASAAAPENFLQCRYRCRLIAKERKIPFHRRIFWHRLENGYAVIRQGIKAVKINLRDINPALKAVPRGSFRMKLPQISQASGPPRWQTPSGPDANTAPDTLHNQV